MHLKTLMVPIEPTIEMKDSAGYDIIEDFLADLKYRLSLPYGDEARIGPDELMSELCGIKPQELTWLTDEQT